MLGRIWARFRAWPLWVQIALGVVVVLVLVPSGDDTSDEATPAASANPTEVSSPEPSQSSLGPGSEKDELNPECIPVAKALVRAIQSGLTVDGGSLRREAFAVRSDDSNEVIEDVWMVAAELDAPGLEGVGDVGVWATTKDPTNASDLGLILRANGIAGEFSDWGEAAEPGSPADFQATDHGVAEAINCVRDRQDG